MRSAILLIMFLWLGLPTLLSAAPVFPLTASTKVKPVQAHYLHQFATTYAARELFSNQPIEEIPIASLFFEQLMQTIKFSSVQDIIPSKSQHVGGGNINLLLLEKDGVNLQAGGGVAYSTFEAPNGIFGNDHLHPNVNMSLGINF